MKKILLAVFIITSIFVLASCKGNSDNTNSQTSSVESSQVESTDTKSDVSVSDSSDASKGTELTSEAQEELKKEMIELIEGLKISE